MTTVPDLADLVAPAGCGLALRRERADDRDFLIALYAGQRAAELVGVPWEAVRTRAFIEHQFAAQQAHYAANRPAADYLIVTHAGSDAPIGRLYVDRSDDPWRLAELALVQEAAGKGLGTALLEGLLTAAADAGANGIDLHVARDNPRGEAFYRRMGFVEVASAASSHKRLYRAIDPIS